MSITINRIRIKTKYGVKEYTKRFSNSKENFINSISGIHVVGEVTDDKNAVIEFEDGKKQECKHFYYAIGSELIKDSVYECFYYDNIFLTVFFNHKY